MTFYLKMKVDDGLVGIADARMTTGAEFITAGKVSIHQHGRHSLFLMISGLRSVRDKVVTYTSSTSVEYPLDVLLYRHNTFDILQHRFLRMSAMTTPPLPQSASTVRIPVHDPPRISSNSCCASEGRERSRCMSIVDPAYSIAASKMAVFSNHTVALFTHSPRLDWTASRLKSMMRYRMIRWARCIMRTGGTDPCLRYLPTTCPTSTVPVIATPF